VSCFLEQVRVGIEGHARSGVAEDAADLDDVEAAVDDQVADEGVAQVVVAQPPTGAIEAGVDGGASQDSLRDVVVHEGAAARGCEHVVGAVREARAVFVSTENRGELGEERDLADGRSCLRWDAVRWHAAATACELVTNMDDAAGEVHVVPAQPEQLREPHTRVGAGHEQRSISVRAGGEEANELLLREHALL
jgi:hypothetical protein